MTLHGVPGLFDCAASVREKQLVAFTLIVTFAVIMRTELGQGPRQRALAEQNQLGQTLAFPRSVKRSLQIEGRFGGTV